MRLADDIGGKGFVIYSGKIEEIQEALSISTEKLSSPELLLNKSIIPNLHSEMAKQLDSSSIFMNNNLTKLEGGEI
jgi:microcompartment protein CcmL/EutN